MGRIVSSVKIDNLTDPDKSLRCEALVDTGASYMILPTAWRDRLGDLEEIETLELETATQEIAKGVICGAVRIQVEGLRVSCCRSSNRRNDGSSCLVVPSRRNYWNFWRMRLSRSSEPDGHAPRRQLLIKY